MSIPTDQIVEPAELPAKMTVISTLVLVIALNSLLVAVVLTAPSLFATERILPFFLGLLVVWVVSLAARITLVGMLPAKSELVLPAKLKQKLWLHGVWKVAWLICSLLAIIGGIGAWVTNLSLQPFVHALVALVVANLIETFVLRAILEIAAIRQHRSIQHRP